MSDSPPLDPQQKHKTNINSNMITLCGTILQKSSRISNVGAGRSFEDMLMLLDRMAARKPVRSVDNIEITRRLVSSLKLQPALDRLRFVHVAGTKGKGTTSAYAAALLQSYGYKVGLFTSPHLTDVRERILVDNALLPRDQFAHYFFELHNRFEELHDSESHLVRETANRANYFRFMFLLSLYIFAQESVDVAVMEVGIGGRIDATNIIKPEVAIITSLGLEHTEILGDTIQEIAQEKAGIMKEGIPCFSSPQQAYPESRRVLENVSRERQAPLVFLDKNVLPIHNWPKLAIGGAHAVEDSKLALMAARHIAGIPPVAPLDEVERTVLQTMTFPGRSQIVPLGDHMTLYLDGAHTLESVESAFQWFLEASAANAGDANPRRVLAFYTSRDPSRILKPFMVGTAKLSKAIFPLVLNPRVAPGESLEDVLNAEREIVTHTSETWRQVFREVPCLPCANPFETLDDLEGLVSLASSENEDTSKHAHVFVTGSFYLLADIIRLIIAREDLPSE